MGVKSNELSDQQILFMFAQNDPMAWNALYESYAALIYGMVCQQTNDQNLREEIFEKVFFYLKNYLLIADVSISLKIMICKVSNKFINDYLLKRGLISPKIEASKRTLINNLLQNTLSIPEMALEFEISESEVKKRIRQEVSAIRNELC